MLILHLSDTHGTMPKLLDVERADLIVHSGDMLPNKTRGTDVEPGFQKDWVIRKRESLWRWLFHGKPVLFVSGNHDFFDPAEILDGYKGLVFRNITERMATFQGLTFYGYPWWPRFTSEWNYEADYSKLVERFQPPEDVDVIVAHCPPYGCLDLTPDDFEPWKRSHHIGNPALTRAIEHDPRLRACQAILCGHCHDQGGREETVRGIKVSNAATTQRLVEVAC